MRTKILLPVLTVILAFVVNGVAEWDEEDWYLQETWYKETHQSYPDPGGVLWVENTSNGIGVRAESYSGIGLEAISDNGTSIRAEGMIEVFGNNSDSRGRVRVYGPNGILNVLLTSPGLEPNRGAVSVYDDTEGSVRAQMFVNTWGVGDIHTLNRNGQLSTRLTGYSGNDPDFGLVEVYDDNEDMQARMYVDPNNNDGVVEADRWDTPMSNPLQPGTDIVYSSLLGSEAAAYIRGTAQLVYGKAIIDFPDHFAIVASPEGMTVQLTPLSAESKGLAVVQKSTEGIVVQELFNGEGNYELDYLVTAVRKGYEDYQVIRPAREASPTHPEYSPY